MGKRRFAGTLASDDHKTTSNKYGNNLEVWIRGWDFGVEIFATQVEGEDVFEIWMAGGSNDRSNGRKYLGTVKENGFDAS